jgi:hypothetical protein
MKRTGKGVKTEILKVPENVNSSAVSPLPGAEILKHSTILKFHHLQNVWQ